MAEPGKWETWQVSEFWDAWQEGKDARVQRIRDEKHEKLEDARSRVNFQEQQIKGMIDRNEPVEQFMRSIDADPAARGILPEAQLRALEQKQGRASPAREVQENSPMPAADRGPLFEQGSRAPSRDYSELKEIGQPARASETHFAKLAEKARANEAKQQTREQGQDRDR
jgi:hypothetical protein